MRPIIILCFLIYLASYQVESIAQPSAPESQKRFTLFCKSFKSPPPPIPTWVVDVNLDLLTYYTQLGGLGEVVSDDGNKIIFRRWSPGPEGILRGWQQAFDRSSEHWYFNVRTDGTPIPPDAVCTASAPREGFKADMKFIVDGVKLDRFKKHPFE